MIVKQICLLCRVERNMRRWRIHMPKNGKGQRTAGKCERIRCARGTIGKWTGREGLKGIRQKTIKSRIWGRNGRRKKDKRPAIWTWQPNAMTRQAMKTWKATLAQMEKKTNTSVVTTGKRVSRLYQPRFGSQPEKCIERWAWRQGCWNQGWQNSGIYQSFLIKCCTSSSSISPQEPWGIGQDCKDSWVPKDIWNHGRRLYRQ